MTPSSLVAPPVDALATPQALRTSIGTAAAGVCRARYGERLRALILTGSLARDEATFVREGEAWRLLGDAEFVAVWDSRRDLPPEPALIALRQEVEATLAARGIVGDVSVAAVPSAYLRSLPPHIFTYELRTCGDVVLGAPDILSLVPAFSSSQLSREDAWRLLCNRIIEQLEPLAGVGQGSASIPPTLHYRSVKLCLDMATSFLTFVDQYAPTYVERRDRLRTFAERNASTGDWPFPLHAFARDVSACTQWKLTPTMREGGENWESWARVREYARGLVRWELGHLVGAGALLPEGDLVVRWSRRQPIRARARGWLFALRREGWRQGWRRRDRWLRLLLKGSPRSCIYVAAIRLYFQVPDPWPFATPEGERSDVVSSREWLPVVAEHDGATARSGWRAVASEVTENYERFVVETRA